MGGNAWVLPLHGSLSSDEQSRVFQEPPPGKTKVTLSTNVLEYSLLTEFFELEHSYN
jgi:HrpA-like RNA helicase